MSEGCHICDASADVESHVYDDGAWVAFATANVPGWVMLATKEHLEGMWSLSADDAAGLGAATRAVSQAVKQATGAHRVHLVFLGESAIHFHLGFFPRAEGEAPLFDASPLVEASKTLVDPERARATAELIRVALADIRPMRRPSR